MAFVMGLFAGMVAMLMAQLVGYWMARRERDDSPREIRRWPTRMERR